MEISTVKSRTDKNVKVIDITYEELREKLKKPKRTRETAEEFKALSKDEQDKIKDVGGFISGKSKDSLRKTGHMEDMCLITLDADYGTPDFLKSLQLFTPFRCLIYSTHKHRPETPRLRIVIPLKHPISEEEYEPLARQVAKDMGMDFFDDSTYQATRIMYWPSASSDGEYVFREIEGEFLNPDEYLDRYTDWHNTAEWPTSSRQEKARKSSKAQKRDPLTLEGWPGAFCRKYTIQEAIAKYLPTIYSPSVMGDRYDYIPGTGSAGAVVYDDKFLYSNHATDPAANRLLNAFELVQLHRFGSAQVTDGNGAPTKAFKKMLDFIQDDPDIKEQMVLDNMPTGFQTTYSGNWLNKLRINRGGEIENCLSNYTAILVYDPAFQNIRFNLLSNSIEVVGKVPWKRKRREWNDTDLSYLLCYFDKTYKISSEKKLIDALNIAVMERAYHPIREWLDNLPEWDGIERVDTLLPCYLGADDTSYTRAVTRKTLVAAIKRVFNPGIKFDTALILVGPQGVGKSTFFSKLGGKWFSDSLSLPEMKDKSSAEKLQGYWILELGELAGIRKADTEVVKSFLSRTDDVYRPAYARVAESHQRQSIIVGSTNAFNGFLRDVTGNRRFWPVKVSDNAEKHPWDMTEEDVKQIWAEAKVICMSGEKLILEEEDAITATEMQNEAIEQDDRTGIVEVYLDTLLPINWDSMDLAERREYLKDPALQSSGCVRRKFVCNQEIWAECFGKPLADMKKFDSYEMTAIMTQIRGWRKYEGNRTGTMRLPIYGKQRIYEREE